MKIGHVTLESPFVVAPMAGMTDTAFRRLVKRQGGCGLVVTEMVSSEGLVRGIDRTLEYAEYTEEERPVSIQIFGGDPGKMAAAAQVVEGMGADIVDINMGCPVPKISKHNAGCSLMRDPAHATDVVSAMVKAVKIPVTVKMRAGWNDATRNAPELASRLQEVCEGAFIARIGGDELAVISPTGPQPRTAEELARRLSTAAAEDFDVDGHPVNAGITIGVAIFPTDGGDHATHQGRDEQDEADVLDRALARLRREAPAHPGGGVRCPAVDETEHCVHR